MQISKKTQYGLRAMAHLAKNYKAGKFIPLKDVSNAEAIPFDFLEKIFLDLEKADLAKSKKGVGGGYILAKKPGKITVKNIVDPLEDTTAVDCSFCGKSRKCRAKNVWEKVDMAVDKTLNSIKLISLIR